MMSANRPVRASDRDRERAASQISESHATGRLDAEEFNERLDRVYEAKTVAELDELTADLPALDLYPLPSASLPRHRPVNTGLPASGVLSQAASGAVQRLPTGWPAAWGSWLIVTLVCGLLWLVSGNAWPLAWAGAAGAAIAGGWVIASARRRRGPGSTLRLPPEAGGHQHDA
jgi:DUF1707 SHOCT-like domain